jgi:membrane protein DedA with SNARE-associated domain
VLPFAGWEVAQGRLAALPAFLAATAGSVAGALILYAVARRGGRPAILATHRVSRITAEDLDRAEARFRRHGVWLVVAGRCVPGVRSIISVPAGMARMPVAAFTALTAAGSGLWNAALMGAGVLLGTRFEEVGEVVGPLSTAVVALLAFAVLAALVVLRRRRRLGPGEPVSSGRS